MVVCVIVKFWHMDDSDGWKHVKSGDRENKNMKIHEY